MAVHDSAVAARPDSEAAAARGTVLAAAHRLLDARRLERSTLVSECLPARDRGDLPPDTCIDDLLGTVDDPWATEVLARCVASVGGSPAGDHLRAVRTG
jgi:hypothetical protein